jgi:phosphatidylglycerophosphate synthase
MAQEKTSAHARTQVIYWSELHAVFMLGGTAFALTLSRPGILVVLAAGSFSALIWSYRCRWSPEGHFGRANAVTAVRLLGILALPEIARLDYLAVAACGVALSALDAVDGWLARRLDLASEFGEYFDKETDALFTLMLCLLLYLGGRLEGWVLLPGLLRYGFVVFLMLAKPPAAKERQSAKSKWISIAMISALIAACSPFPVFYQPYAMLTTLMLLYSFADSIVDLYRPSREAPRA